jgi:PAS domain S-box-containing protein
MARPQTVIKIRPYYYYLSIYVALPLAYIVTGRVGLLLAVPPGYATAVFMPAGLAVGSFFLAGSKTLVGTFVGSFILNIWIGTGQVELTRIIGAAVIALASTAQAGVGGVALRRLVGKTSAFDNPHDVFLFLLLTPIICVTSASLSLGGLWSLGLVSFVDLPINWLTWWVGDTLGVLVVVPLLQVFASEPRRLWRSRFLFVALPMLVCLGVFIAIFIRVSRWENEQALLEFRLRSQQLADTIKATLEEQAGFLEQLSSSFLTRHELLSRQDFRELVEKLLQRFPTIQAVEWAPYVSASDRNSFELEAKRILPGFTISELGEANGLRPKPIGEDAFPVFYIEPLAENIAVLGFDLASDPTRLNAIDASIAKDVVVATAPIRLVQERSQQLGMLLIQHVSGGPNGRGLVLIVLRMATFAKTLARAAEPTLDLRFADAEANVPFLNQIAESVLPTSETRFEFGGRDYVVQTAPTALYISLHRGWESWAVLAVGALATGLLGALLMLGTGHTFRVQSLAERLRSSESSLRQREAELDAIVQRTPFMLIRLGRDLRYRFISRAYAEVTGRQPEAVVGKTLREVIGEENFEAIRPYVERVLRGERVEFEREVNFPRLGSRVMDVVYTPDLDDTGQVIGWIASIFDVTERKRATETERMLVSELQHRSNNLLTVVQAIAQRSLAGSTSVAEAKQTFQARLNALARTNKQLTNVNWTGLGLADIVRAELEPFSNRSKVSGPIVILGPQQAQNFALAIHELATNAAKHGALSSAIGEVRVSWKLASNDEARVLNFEWQEAGGPPVVAEPTRQGFGTALIKAVFENAVFEYPRPGFGCRIEIKIA